MANSCEQTSISVDYSPGVLNLLNLQEGYSYADFLEFFDLDGVVEDITTYDFTMVIKDDAGTTVSTLTTGSITADGLEIEGDNKLNFLIGTDVTGTAGVYTLTLRIADPALGSNYVLAIGKIKVV